MTEKQYIRIFQTITKCIFTVLTGPCQDMQPFERICQLYCSVQTDSAVHGISGSRHSAVCAVCGSLSTGTAGVQYINSQERQDSSV